jgi:hypothetical protein
MNPNMFIVINVSSASEAIEAYKAIIAAQSAASSVTLPLPSVQSSGCASAPARVSEEQTLRDEYKSKHPTGKGFRLTKEQIASGAKFNTLDPVQVGRAMKHLRDAVEQLRAGTFVVTQEDSEPQVGENHADTGEYF